MKNIVSKVWSAVLVGTVILLLNSHASAGRIDDPAVFGADPPKESFEQLDILPQWSGGGDTVYLYPAATSASPFAFLSGVKMVRPIPNDAVMNPAAPQPQIWIGDFRVGNARYFYGKGNVIASQEDLPVVSETNYAYLGFQFKPKGQVSPLHSVEFSFPGNLLQRVGAYVNDLPGNKITIEAVELVETTPGQYKEIVIGSDSIIAGQVRDWNKQFLGWYDPQGRIDIVRFTGEFLAIDELMFQMPQPSSILLIGLGLTVLYIGKRRACLKHSQTTGPV